MTISAVIITRNESRNIRDCLASLSFCDEIVVLDNGSDDNTVLISRAMGARVFETTEWLGFGPQKQKAMTFASCSWILSIDADERVSETLRREILRVTAMDASKSYEFRRVNFFLGKEMHFGGWSNDHVLRLAKRNRCVFSEDLVHESLKSSDERERLNGALLHYSYFSVEQVLDKQVHYSKLGGKRLLLARRTSNWPLMKCLWTFFRVYFLRLGFLDGWRGTLAAVAKAYETFWRYALTRELL